MVDACNSKKFFHIGLKLYEYTKKYFCISYSYNTMQILHIQNLHYEMQTLIIIKAMLIPVQLLYILTSMCRYL